MCKTLQYFVYVSWVFGFLSTESPSITSKNFKFKFKSFRWVLNVLIALLPTVGYLYIVIKRMIQEHTHSPAKIVLYFIVGFTAELIFFGASTLVGLTSVAGTKKSIAVIKFISESQARFESLRKLRPHSSSNRLKFRYILNYIYGTYAASLLQLLASISSFLWQIMSNSISFVSVLTAIINTLSILYFTYGLLFIVVTGIHLVSIHEVICEEMALAFQQHPQKTEVEIKNKTSPWSCSQPHHRSFHLGNDEIAVRFQKLKRSFKIYSDLAGVYFLCATFLVTLNIIGTTIRFVAGGFSDNLVVNLILLIIMYRWSFLMILPNVSNFIQTKMETNLSIVEEGAGRFFVEDVGLKIPRLGTDLNGFSSCSFTDESIQAERIGRWILSWKWRLVARNFHATGRTVYTVIFGMVLTYFILFFQLFATLKNLK